jgi:hypothetical protein
VDSSYGGVSVTKRVQAKLPFTKTARKYGYIAWRKHHDPMVKSIFDNKKFVDLVIEKKLHKKKSIDWKRRRIGITYSLTHSIPNSKQIISIVKDEKGKIAVTFT